MTLFDRDAKLEDAINAEVVCYARVDSVDQFQADLPGVCSSIGKPVMACEVGLRVMQTVKGSHADKRRVIWRSATLMRSSLQPGNTNYVSMLRRSGTMPQGFNQFLTMLPRKQLKALAIENDVDPDNVEAIYSAWNPFNPVFNSDGDLMWEFAQSIGQSSPAVIEDTPAVRLRLSELLGSTQ